MHHLRGVDFSRIHLEQLLHGQHRMYIDEPHQCVERRCTHRSPNMFWNPMDNRFRLAKASLERRIDIKT